MKKVVRLNESDIVRLVKKVISENKKMLKEDYQLSNPNIQIKQYKDNQKFNEIWVKANGLNYYYKINFSEKLGKADGSDNYKVNFANIRQQGDKLILDRYDGPNGQTSEVQIDLNDIKKLGIGQSIEKDTGVGKVFVKLFATYK
jgi:hypothetical protein